MSREALKYGNADASVVFARATAIALATLYASLTALQAVADTVFISFEDPESGDRPIRGNVYLLGVGSDGQAVGADAYLVFRSNLDGKEALRLQKIGAMSSTLGADAVDATLGGRSNQVWAKAAAFTGVGMQEALSGGALSVKAFPTSGGGAGSPAGYAVYDVGPAIGMVICPHKGAATSANVAYERWA